MRYEIFIRYFNPRSREGSDITISRLHQMDIISIHAPAKGATGTPKVMPCLVNISIHAPAKGATFYNLVNIRCLCISIHAPAKGATSVSTPPILCSSFISIHAPAKGATLKKREKTSRSANFNPRSREGSDCSRHNRRSIFSVFQSTLPRRERRRDAP